MAKKEEKENKKNSEEKQKSDNELALKIPENLPKEAQEKIKEIKEKIDKFQKEVLKKFDKYVMGIALLPPQKDKDGNLEKDAVNLLVLVDDSDSQKMSKFELKDKLSVIIGKIGEETDKNFRVQTIILS